jgi:hypothetical protein
MFAWIALLRECVPPSLSRPSNDVTNRGDNVTAIPVYDCVVKIFYAATAMTHDAADAVADTAAERSPVATDNDAASIAASASARHHLPYRLRTLNAAERSPVAALIASVKRASVAAVYAAKCATVAAVNAATKCVSVAAVNVVAVDPNADASDNGLKVIHAIAERASVSGVNDDATDNGVICFKRFCRTR